MKVLDFGGAMGSTYFRYRNLLKNCNPQWSIIEQHHYVDYGKANIPEINFYHHITEYKNDADVLLLSSVLAYLENPYGILEECLDRKIPYVIVDETAFAPDDQDHIKLQNIPASIYKAVYPMHLFSKSNFLEFMSKHGYEVVWEWDYRFGDIPYKNGFSYQHTIEKGFLLKKKDV